MYICFINKFCGNLRDVCLIIRHVAFPPSADLLRVPLKYIFLHSWFNLQNHSFKIWVLVPFTKIVNCGLYDLKKVNSMWFEFVVILKLFCMSQIIKLVMVVCHSENHDLRAKLEFSDFDFYANFKQLQI